MQISQANINKMNTLFQCGGWQQCRYSDCPLYSASEQKCDWERFLSTFSACCAQNFDKNPIEEAKEVIKTSEEETCLKK